MKQEFNDWLLRLVRIQLTLSADTDDLRELIVVAISKIAQYSSSSEEKFRIEHIDSLSHLYDMDE